MKISKKKIKGKLLKVPKFLAAKAFLACMVLFLIVLVLGGFIFYEYLISAKRITPEITERQLQFEGQKYQEVLRVWQEREEKFSKASSRQYSDPFWTTTTTSILH